MEIGRIALKKLLNTRDLGGIAAADGRKIKPKRLLRSGALFEAAPEDCEVLVQDYGLKVVVDFRTSAERAGSPDPELPGVENFHLPVYDSVGFTRKDGSDEDLSGLAIRLTGHAAGGDGWMTELYRGFVTSGVAKYKQFFALLLEQREGAVLWHCTAGKDRAGTASALLLRALGASRETALADYLKTNDFAGELLDFLAEEVVKKTGHPEAKAAAYQIVRAEKAYFDALFDEMDKVYGSEEAFFEGALGLTQGKRAQLRALYLES